MAVSISSDANNITAINCADQSSAPTAPGSGRTLIFTKDGLVYKRASGGAAVALGDLANPMTAEDDIIIGGSSGAPTRLTKGTDSQVLTVSASTHHLVWATPDTPSAGAMVQIALTTVGAGGAASVDFSSIPSDYNSLMLMWTGRSSDASASGYLAIRCNNDSGNNYYSEETNARGSTHSVGETLAANYAKTGYITGANASSGIASGGKITIPFYKQTTFNKVIVCESSMQESTSSAKTFIFQTGAHWLSAAAINRLTLFPYAGNLVEGTAIALYGIT